MKMSTRLISALVAMVIAMSLCIPAFATSKSSIWGTAFDLQERFGSNNTTAQVKTLQRVLEQFYYDDFLGNSFVDGGFGPATETKVKQFQTRYGLPSDGRVGTDTWNKMQDRIGAATTSGTLTKYYVKNRLVLGLVRTLAYTTSHYTYYIEDDWGRPAVAYYVYTDIYFKYYSNSMSWYILSAPDGISSSTSTLIN